MPQSCCAAVVERASSHTKRGYASISEKVRSPDVRLFYDTRLWLVARGLVYDDMYLYDPLHNLSTLHA